MKLTVMQEADIFARLDNMERQGSGLGKIRDSYRNSPNYKTEKEPRSRKEMMDFLELTNAKYFRKRYLNPLLKMGKMRMTLPNKPQSHNQKYVCEDENSQQ